MGCLDAFVGNIGLESWHQVIVRRTPNAGSSITTEVFFDGIPYPCSGGCGGECERDAEPSEVIPTSDPLLVGKRNDDDGRIFAVDGLIDEVAIWNRPLFPAEIAFLASGNRVSDLEPVTGIVMLKNLVESFNLLQGTGNSLEAKLDGVLAALQAANAGNRMDAANKLQAFIGAVEAQRGKKLTDAQADALVELASKILAGL